MADRPIIFSAPMVRALLDGRKTMTRRVLRPQPDTSKISAPFHPEARGGRKWVFMARDDFPGYSYATADFRAPYAIGDRLWVRETWATVNSECGPGWAYRADGDFVQPEYDGHDYGVGPSFDYDKYPGEYTMWYPDLLAGSPGHNWKSPRYMPRWASRLTLIVKEVRVQRLQEIETDDCYEEGAKCDVSSRTIVEHFRNLWDSLNARRGYPWESNPWVCALTFDVIRQNIDTLPTGSAAGM